MARRASASEIMSAFCNREDSKLQETSTLHRIASSACRSASRSAALRPTRSSSRGPHTGRKSHHVQARSAGRSGQEALLDGAIDDRQHLETLAARVVVDRDLVLGEPADGRAVEQPALPSTFLPSPCSIATLYSTGCSTAPPPTIRSGFDRFLPVL